MRVSVVVPTARRCVPLAVLLGGALSLVGLLAPAGRAGETNSLTGKTAPTVTTEPKLDRKIVDLIPPPPLMRPAKVGGVTGKVIGSPNRLQLLNPLAPPEYGDGTDSLSINPTTGRAEGVNLITFRLPEFFTSKKAKKAAAKKKAGRERP